MNVQAYADDIVLLAPTASGLQSLSFKPKENKDDGFYVKILTY